MQWRFSRRGVKEINGRLAAGAEVQHAIRSVNSRSARHMLEKSECQIGIFLRDQLARDQFARGQRVSNQPFT